MLVTHSACDIVHRYEQDKLEFLVFDYRCVDPNTNRLTEKEIRFPAGTGNLGESTEETSIRKLYEETGLITTDVERIARRQAGQDHEKYVFLIPYSRCSGELRQGLLSSGGDEMSPPYWMPIFSLMEMIAPVHFWAYRVAIEHFRKQR
ncbi:MAG: hypothetical protein UT07_C0011G0007 [Parcubacteria group bacterium GW2011_GWB1_38_8]|nr:MAG: hypothetical protein UT07_C0011G0007 [Parcubacteria group bacterium GW2011_GWB1_38_8]